MQPPGKRNTPGLRSASFCTRSGRSPLRVSAGKRETCSTSTAFSGLQRKMRSFPLTTVSLGLRTAVYFFHSFRRFQSLLRPCPGLRSSRRGFRAQHGFCRCLRRARVPTRRNHNPFLFRSSLRRSPRCRGLCVSHDGLQGEGAHSLDCSQKGHRFSAPTFRKRSIP